MLLSSKVQKMKDEIQALKVAQPINGGALTKHSANASWTGIIDKDSPISRFSLLAAFIMRFERRDGIVKTPLVQFAFSLSPNDSAYGAVIATSSDSVSYKISLPDNWWPPEESESSTVQLTIEGKAYSPVEGVLTIERIYS